MTEITHVSTVVILHTRDMIKNIKVLGGFVPVVIQIGQNHSLY